MPSRLARIGHNEINFGDLPDAFQAYLDGMVTGRTVVRIEAPGD